jgi:hypothetical protein
VSGGGGGDASFLPTIAVSVSRALCACLQLLGFMVASKIAQSVVARLRHPTVQEPGENVASLLHTLAVRGPCRCPSPAFSPPPPLLRTFLPSPAT